MSEMWVQSMNLKYKQDKIRFGKTSDLCKGKIIHLGASDNGADYDLQRFLEEEHKVVISADLDKADVIQDFNEPQWTIRNKFDTVLAGEIIEHVHNPTSFIKNCVQLLKPKGRLIISTPNASSLIYLYNPDWCVNYQGNSYEQDEGHIHCFTTGMLRFLMEKHGVKRVDFEYLNGYLGNPFGYFVCSFVPSFRGDILIWGDVK